MILLHIDLNQVSGYPKQPKVTLNDLKLGENVTKSEGINFIQGGIMEGQSEIVIVERYGNSDSDKNGLSVVVGFTADRAAYMSRLILDSSGDWTAWEPIGSAVDYDDNQHYASLNGCTFKLDETA